MSKGNDSAIRVHPVHYVGDDQARIAGKGDSVDAWGVYSVHSHDTHEMWEADFDTKEEAENFARDFRRSIGEIPHEDDCPRITDRFNEDCTCD